MHAIDINTSQNVQVSFEVASVGDRILAFVIDSLIKFIYLFVLWFILNENNLNAYMAELDQWSAIAIIGLLTLPINVYTLFFESLMEGQTPGKRIMKIRVIKTDGYQAELSDYFTRWIFRLIDIFIGMGVIALITIVINKDNKRLGDIAAGTAVITLKSKYNINHTILVNIAETYTPTFPQVVALSDNDMRIIKENFLQAKKNLDRSIIRKLAQKICETTGIPNDKQNFTDQQFIAVVIKDYNFYTGKN